jgi:periplasmic protein TonB
MLSTPKRSALLSWLLHCGAILLILAVTSVKPQLISRLREILVVPADIASYKTSAKAGGGGGGGGVHADTPSSRGKAPDFALRQFVPPVVKIENSTPILPMEPTLIGDPNIKPVSLSYKDYGDLNGVLGKLSGGSGTGNGIGSGHGTGDGPGDGPGLGPGKNGGTGGEGVGYLGTGGGAVTQPTLISKTEPEYSEDARKARLQGTVRLRIEVDTHGTAQNIVVSQSLGLGLDDRAIDAVRKWRFNPGKVNGKPAAVVAYVEVNFRLL